MSAREHLRSGRAVALKDNRLGREFKTPQQSFSLSYMFSETAKQLGGDRFVAVYFETHLGNLYRLDDRGELIDANQTKINRQKVSTQMKPTELEKKTLIVGEPFTLVGGNDRYSAVKEIVATTSKRLDMAHLDLTTGGKSNDIIDRFQRYLPFDIEDYDELRKLRD